ncbi:MAG: hypothetical protein KR126chlam3_01339 [Chlamydiae bacterium]|nr:hypothetical protein [Chlamydiota bacterium]
MDKNSTSKVISFLNSSIKKGEIPSKEGKLLLAFYTSYQKTVGTIKDVTPIFLTFLKLMIKQFKEPYPFEPYHKQIRKPFDYYQFGKDFVRPLIDRGASSISGKERLREISEHLSQGHNAIFLANHQTEADPQAIFLMLEEEFEILAEQLIIIAGERVITDPLAIPFSMGCNLLCIYSKRYIDHPPEKKHKKQLHNRKTMQLMSELLKEGGKCIYVAPSGGRDRRNARGELEIAPFDPKSIEMFYLMAKKSKIPTFFYPMALGTYNLLPPPETIQVELGEERSLNRAGVHLSVGPQIDMEHYPGMDHPDKHLRRKSKADYIWKLVHDDYQKFPR